MKVISPFGEYPFQFRRVQRREGGVAVLGTVAGVQSGAVLDAADLRAAAIAVVAVAAAGTALGAAVTLARRR